MNETDLFLWLIVANVWGLGSRYLVAMLTPESPEVRDERIAKLHEGNEKLDSYIEANS